MSALLLFQISPKQWARMDDQLREQAIKAGALPPYKVEKLKKAKARQKQRHIASCNPPAAHLMGRRSGIEMPTEQSHCEALKDDLRWVHAARGEGPIEAAAGVIPKSAAAYAKYDPRNYCADTPTQQQFILRTDKGQAPVIPPDWVIGSGLVGRLLVRAYLTDGTFGRCFVVQRLSGDQNDTVVEEPSTALSAQSGDLVVKIMRPAAKHGQYVGDASIEAEYLQLLMDQQDCPESVVKYFGSFSLSDPIQSDRVFRALLFEHCGASLYEFWQQSAQKQPFHQDDTR